MLTQNHRFSQNIDSQRNWLFLEVWCDLYKQPAVTIFMYRQRQLILITT